jgi:hypothetical protein
LYPGYVDPELPNGPQQYWRTNLPRLEQIKAVVDPGDVFHNPQSVVPAGFKPLVGKRDKLRSFSAKTLQRASTRLISYADKIRP